VPLKVFDGLHKQLVVPSVILPRESNTFRIRLRRRQTASRLHRCPLTAVHGLVQLGPPLPALLFQPPQHLNRRAQVIEMTLKLVDCQ
jgi:hypothetical protein